MEIGVLSAGIPTKNRPTRQRGSRHVEPHKSLPLRHEAGIFRYGVVGFDFFSLGVVSHVQIFPTGQGPGKFIDTMTIVSVQ